MSLPGDAMPNIAPPVALLAPDSLPRPSRVVDYERGGIGLNDPSQGINVRNWTADLDGNEVRVYPSDNEGAAVVLFSDAGISQLSLAFDQNMRPAVAYVAFNQAKLYWYDTALGAVTTTILGPDVRSPMLSMDDKRDFASTANTNDILLFYIRSNRRCYRQQRERFQTEHTLAWFEGTKLSINKAGMNVGNRMQVEIVGLSNRVATGAVLGAWGTAAYLASVTAITLAMPLGIATGDLLYAAVMHRSAMSPPAGWTLQTSVQCEADGLVQTLSLFRKTTPAPADSGANVTFTQAASGRMGVSYFAVRATSGTPTLIASAAANVDDLATNTINAATATAAGPELVVAVGTSINATADVTIPFAPGLSVVSGSASQSRLAVAYQLRTVGQPIAPRITFNNGTPALNGLAALTLRFGTT